MKSYLELVKNYEKVHRSQNRITILCIVIAVSLVTTIFGMADMEIRSQRVREIKEHGNWHFAIKMPVDQDIQALTGRFGKQIEASGYVLGFSKDETWQYGDQTFRLTGGDEEMIANFGLEVEQGQYPYDNSQIMIDALAAKQLDISVGDSMDMLLSSGQTRTFQVSGLYENSAVMLEMGFNGIVLGTDLASELYEDTVYRKTYYVCLKDTVAARRIIDQVKEELSYSDDDISENTALLAMSGQSRDSYMIQLYGVALALFFLVLVAGVLMISGTFNTNVEERTQFFGMLRCLGATKHQIKKYVLYESMRFLRIAVPIGVIIGVVTYWGACAYLKYENYEFFSEMPMFGFSLISLLGGVSVGLITVLLAALAPCRKAARVSPLSAVTANQYTNGIKSKHCANTGIFHVEDALGMHHATSNKKSLFLMIGSFGISIVLFLSFSVVVSFMHHALTPLEAWSPDLEYSSQSFLNSLSKETVETIQSLDGVRKIFGRKYLTGTLGIEEGEQNASILTYETNQFQYAEKYLIEGDIEAIAEGEPKLMLAYSIAYPYHVGDHVIVSANGVKQELEVGAIVSKTPFKPEANDAIVVMNESCFSSFSEEEGYAVVDIQLKKNQPDELIEEIRALAGPVGNFSDSRLSNAQVKAVNSSFSTFIYGFLAIIALITVFNIINSMNMSISARLRQYGVMHAVGMSVRQIKRMVFAEASTYAVLGCIFGGVAGLFMNNKLFGMLVTFRWGTKWSLPWQPLLVIALLVIGSTVVSVIGPLRKCRHFSSSHIG